MMWWQERFQGSRWHSERRRALTFVGEGLRKRQGAFRVGYGFAVIGAGLSAAHAAEASCRSSARLKNADGTLDLSPMQALADRIGSRLANSLSIGPQVEIAGMGGMRAPAPARMPNERQPLNQSPKSEPQAKTKTERLSEVTEHTKFRIDRCACGNG